MRPHNKQNKRIPAMEHSEAWLANTLRGISEGVIATNMEGEVVFMNPVAEQLTGWSGLEAHGRPVMDVLTMHQESTGALAENLPAWQLFARTTHAYTVTSRTGSSSTVDLTRFENRSDKQLGAILVLRDIGARRQLEKRAMQSQRMEAVANLAAGLAHDFNNQLMVVLGCADELCGRLSGADRDRAFEIKHACTLAAALTGQLLTLSRHQATHAEPLDLNEVVVEMQPSISSALGKVRALTTTLGATLGRVRADRNQLKQVLLNLALNARDAMPDGGELHVETSNIDIQAGSRKAEAFAPGEYVRLLVSDSGEGMEPETLARIFEPFFTTKKPGFGTGLGLSMVHSIVLQSGGNVSARSELGLGTAFEILLPRLAAFDAAEKLAGEETHSPLAAAALTVLLVDDEDRVRRTMYKYLAKAGYRLLEARNGEEAAEIAQGCDQPIDALITDVMMPGMNGPELAEHLSAKRPDLKVLFVSGYPGDFLKGRDLGRSPHCFLLKPFSAAELMARVRTLLADHSTMAN